LWKWEKLAVFGGHVRLISEEPQFGPSDDYALQIDEQVSENDLAFGLLPAVEWARVEKQSYLIGLAGKSKLAREAPKVDRHDEAVCHIW
jgi:hypothetical protein